MCTRVTLPNFHGKEGGLRFESGRGLVSTIRFEQERGPGAGASIRVWAVFGPVCAFRAALLALSPSAAADLLGPSPFGVRTSLTFTAHGVGHCRTPLGVRSRMRRPRSEDTFTLEDIALATFLPLDVVAKEAQWTGTRTLTRPQVQAVWEGLVQKTWERGEYNHCLEMSLMIWADDALCDIHGRRYRWRWLWKRFQ
jgi:hypothetical protein